MMTLFHLHVQGSMLGKAYGFKVTSLQRFSTTLANVSRPNVNILHYLVTVSPCIIFDLVCCALYSKKADFKCVRFCHLGFQWVRTCIVNQSVKHGTSVGM